MGLSLKILFYKKISNKNELYYYELSSSGKEIHNQVKSIMKKLVSIYIPYKKMEQGFVSYDSIELYYNDEKKETLYPIKIHKGSKLNIEYLLNFNWTDLTEADICKIIDLNFPFLIWTIKENKRNRIRNLANTDNPFLLSNGQGVVKFKAEIFSVNTHIDPLFIKKSHYKTLIKYRS